MSIHNKLWKRRRSQADFSQEVESHIEIETERLIGEGLPPDEARAAARRAFGNVTASRERFYESQRNLHWLDDFARDARHALRSLRRTPAFTIVALLTLAF